MESAIMLGLQSIRIDGLTQLLVLISSLGNSALIWVLLGIAFLPFASKRGVGVFLLITVIVTGVVSSLIIGNIVGRPHPCEVVQGLAGVAGVTRTGGSMPSFHAATSFAAAVFLWVTCGKKIGTPCIVLAILICFARMYLGVQYPTDVLVGIVIGVVFALVFAFIFMKFAANASSGGKHDEVKRAKRRSL